MQLIIFDCDGTLVDSHHLITKAMTAAFDALALDNPPPEEVRAIIGLSLAEAISRLAPHASISDVDRLCAVYREAHLEYRTASTDHETLFEGIETLIHTLGANDEVLLGIATGKSRRGLNTLLERHGFTNRFVTLQTADDAPSKPDPGMLQRAMYETGVDAVNTIMIGDTSFDMMMARNANVAAIGVAWGYHPVEALSEAGAEHIAWSSQDILDIVGRMKTEVLP